MMCVYVCVRACVRLPANTRTNEVSTRDNVAVSQVAISCIVLLPIAVTPLYHRSTPIYLPKYFLLYLAFPRHIHTCARARSNSDPTRKVSPLDLRTALTALGKSCSKREIADMIWEVDENLDGCVDWEEFLTMFERNIMDTSGLEPFQLFNVVQFMMYDKDNSGNVTVDETMHMLYARYGKQHLESQMKALFGEDLKTADGDGELSFEEYLKAVSIRLPKTKGKSKKGRK